MLTLIELIPTICKIHCRHSNLFHRAIGSAPARLEGSPPSLSSLSSALFSASGRVPRNVGRIQRMWPPTAWVWQMLQMKKERANLQIQCLGRHFLWKDLGQWKSSTAWQRTALRENQGRSERMLKERICEWGLTMERLVLRRYYLYVFGHVSYYVTWR